MRPFAWEGQNLSYLRPAEFQTHRSAFQKSGAQGGFAAPLLHIHLAAAPFLPVQAHCEPGSPDCETLPQAACRAWRDSAWTFVTIFQEDAR